MKNYLNRFLREEEGTELIEWAIGIAIIAILAGTVFAIAQTANSKMTQANELIGQIDPNKVLNGGTGTGTNTGTNTSGTGGTKGTGGPDANINGIGGD